MSILPMIDLRCPLRMLPTKRTIWAASLPRNDWAARPRSSGAGESWTEATPRTVSRTLSLLGMPVSSISIWNAEVDISM